MRVVGEVLLLVGDGAQYLLIMVGFSTHWPLKLKDRSH